VSARGAARRLARAIVLALALAGCDGDDPVKRGVLGVGAVLPLSGPDGRTGEQILMGLELACDEEGPGPLATVRAMDGQGRPLESVRAFRELVADPAIHVAVGGWFASSARAVAATAGSSSGESSGLPFLALSPAAAPREVPAGCFPLHRIEALAEAAAVFARVDLGARSAAVVRTPDSEVARLLADAFVRAFPRDGARVAWDATLDAAGTLVLPPGPEPRLDVLYVAGPGEVAAAACGHSARTRSAALLTADGWSRTGLTELAEEGVAIYLVSAFSATDPSVANRKLLEACARSGREPNPALALGWDAGRLARHAAARGGPSREGVTGALRGGPFAGATGRIEFPVAGAGSETPAVSSFGRAGVVFLKRVETVGRGTAAGG
jgi:ABC-type branched-subunit amino acid transport system substrate-binding protein